MAKEVKYEFYVRGSYQKRLMAHHVRVDHDVFLNFLVGPLGEGKVILSRLDSRSIGREEPHENQKKAPEYWVMFCMNTPEKALQFRDMAGIESINWEKMTWSE